MQNANPLFKPEEAAKYLRVSTRSLIRWRNRRIGPAWTKVGGQVVYQERDLQAYLDNRRVLPVAEAEA